MGILPYVLFFKLIFHLKICLENSLSLSLSFSLSLSLSLPIHPYLSKLWIQRRGHKTTNSLLNDWCHSYRQGQLLQTLLQSQEGKGSETSQTWFSYHTVKNKWKFFTAAYNLLSGDYLHCPKMQYFQQMCPYAT